MSYHPPKFLTRKGFESWLKAFPHKNCKSGQSGNVCNCPIATYIKSIKGDDKYIGVGDSVIQYGDETYPSPVWAGEFVRKVDNMSPKSIPVKAGVALRILSEIK